MGRRGFEWVVVLFDSDALAVFCSGFLQKHHWLKDNA